MRMWFWLFLFSMEVADEQNLSCRRRASREPSDVLSISQFSLLSWSLSSLSLSLLSLVHTHFLASHPNPPLLHTHLITHTHKHLCLLGLEHLAQRTIISKHGHAKTYCTWTTSSLSVLFTCRHPTHSCRSARVDMQEVRSKQNAWAPKYNNPSHTGTKPHISPPRMSAVGNWKDF